MLVQYSAPMIQAENPFNGAAVRHGRQEPRPGRAARQFLSHRRLPWRSHGSRSMKIFARFFAVFALLAAAGVNAQQLVNCAPATPCTTSGGSYEGAGAGDQAWLAFGKLNQDALTLWPLLSGNITAGANITVTGTWPNYTITAAGGSSAFASLTSGTNTSAAMVIGAGSSLNATSTGVLQQQGSSVTATFNIIDYGAVCDGSTDDAAAISSAIAAAKASTAYTSPNYGEVIVTGPTDANHPACAVGSSGTTYGINATQLGSWNVLGNGLSPNRMVFRNLNIRCSDPSSLGIVCFDASDSLNLDFENTVSIQGNTTHPPLVGLAIGNYVAGNPCCIGYHREQIYGDFIFANLYDMASESTNFYGVMYSNGYTARGSIDLLGTLTGGSGYDGGGTATYTCVALTGGSGAGATATIKVTSGVVTSVVPCLGGLGYVATDSFSATAANLGNNGGSGFSQALSTIVNWGAVLDGQAHWMGILPNGGSHWYTATAVKDTQYSFTQTNFFRRFHPLEPEFVVDGSRHQPAFLSHLLERGKQHARAPVRLPVRQRRRAKHRSVLRYSLRG